MELTPEIIKNTANQYGEAFYILDTEHFKTNFLELREEFQKIYKKSNIAYSYKTNYTPKLCKIVNDLGGYAEVVSDMECQIALKIGVNPEKIVWNGPYKNPKSLIKLVLEGVNVNVDSFSDLKVIEQIALENPQNKISAGIRCNFDIGDGVKSRFGFDVEGEEFQKALSIFQNTQNLVLKGIHCHFASRDLKMWPIRAMKMIEIAEQYQEESLEYICLGGGLFGKMEESLKEQFQAYIPGYEEYAQAGATLFQEKYGKMSFEKQPELLIEPGSALVGDAMKFAAKVMGIKSVRGKNIATLLGSIYNINPTLNTKNPPLKIISMQEQQSQQYQNLDFGGFTCIESDYLYKGYSGKLAVGDYAVFGNVGSYSIVLKPPFILPNFAIVEYEKENIILIKEPECFNDLFHTFLF
ncbi:MAG: alanine racemase [Lachnospiraceae bacterium]